ncbi:MAG: hypothetical protein EPN33_03530 [Acidobacteria bacterium]|nr:MAG: hypothetical protein EPN33_03530 [Acidobacteriota bacterium]
MLQSYTPVPLEHFGGLVTNWPAEMLDCDLMVEATNVRYTQSAVSVREGLTLAMATPSGAAVRGLVDYVQLNGAEQPLVFDADGNLYVESAAGSGRLVSAAPGSPVVLPASAWMNGASAYNRAYLAFGSGLAGTAAPAVFDGTNLDPVTIAAPGTVASGADSATAGNIAAGARYGVVMFKNREGSLSQPSLPFNWTAVGSKEAVISSLPTGPQSCVARVVAFTVAGGTSAGPYFYIETPATVNGVNETVTVIDDNTTTSITVNFDDDYLAASNNAADQFRAMQLPNVQGVLFSQTTQRLLWWGDPAQPSTVYCSEPGDAGLYLGDTGFFQVAEGSGLKVTACFEFRNQLYVALERGLYLVTPNDGDPATWSITHIAHSVGACSPRALAVGTSFVFMVCPSGAYLFDGGAPQWISEELLGPSHLKPGAWDAINWAQAALIWCAIDHNNKTVRVGCPTGTSLLCDTIYKVSYMDGWEPSQRFSAFTARYHYFPGRRWSLDTIAASQAVAVRRPVTLGDFPADRRQVNEQVLVASAQPDGAIYRLDPDSAQDGGTAIAWALTTGAFSASELLRRQRQGIEMAGLIQVRATGTATVSLESITDGGAAQSIGSVSLNRVSSASHQTLALVQGEAISLRLNSSQGSMQLQSIYLFMKSTWALRANSL